LAGEFEWSGDGKILYVVPAEKVANLMFIQHSNTLITFTYTQIHSHTLTYSQIHSNTIIKYSHSLTYTYDNHKKFLTVT